MLDQGVAEDRLWRSDGTESGTASIALGELAAAFGRDPLDGPMRFTVTKFGTAYGQWARRYLEWDNPMVTAPLAYEWVTTAGDGQTAPTVAPPVAGFLARSVRWP